MLQLYSLSRFLLKAKASSKALPLLTKVNERLYADRSNLLITDRRLVCTFFVFRFSFVMLPPLPWLRRPVLLALCLVVVVALRVQGGVVWDKSGSKVVFIKSVILVELLPLPIAFYVNDAWAAAAWRQSFDFGSSRRRHRSSVG